MRMVSIISAPAKDKITGRVKVDTEFYRADMLRILGSATVPSTGPFAAIWTPAPASPVGFNEGPAIIGGIMPCILTFACSVAAAEQISLERGISDAPIGQQVEPIFGCGSEKLGR
jgi:hypothetical protein